MGDLSMRFKLQEDATTKLSKIASTAKNTASTMQQAGKAMDSAFKTTAPGRFASEAGKAINSAVSAAESLGDAIDEAFEGIGSAGGNFDKAESSFSGVADRADELAKAAERAGESMEDVFDTARDAGRAGGEGLSAIGDDASKAGQELDSAADSALNFGNVLKTVFAAVSVAAVAGKVKDFVSGSVEAGMGFSSMMSEVSGISGASGADLAQLEQTAREYGATTVFSATEAAEALKYMSLAGWDAQQSTSALGGVLNLAAASGMGLGEASDMVTDYLSAFGMEASQASYFADMLSYAQSHSNTTAAQLGDAYLNAAANLHAAGQDVETTTSLLEAMANQGAKGSVAGTQLAAISRDITNNMKDGRIMIGETAVQVADASGNFRDFTDILTDVETAVDGLGDADRASALAMTFTADSTKGINQILTEGMENISHYEDELRGSTGAAEAAANTMNDNLAGDMANMNSAFEEMQLQVFEGMEGTARSGVQYITGTVIPTLTEWVPGAIETVTEAIGKVGKVLSPMIETVLRNPQGVATAFGAIGTGIAAFKAINRVSALTSLASAGGALSESGGLVGGLAKFGNVLAAHPWAAGAAAVAAAVVAIKGAVDEYNEIQVENSLSEHFGTIELTKPEIQSMAGSVIGVDWVADINLALGKFENAEELHRQAEEALQRNETLTWEAKVKTIVGKAEGEPDKYPYDVTLDIKLTPEMQEDYKSNIQTYLSSKEAELNSLTEASLLSMETMLGDKAGSAWIERVSQWAADDTADMTKLSSSLTALVEEALKDGVFSVEEQAAIDILQEKINSIVSGWQEAQADAEWQTLEMKWSGKDLEPGSFVSLIEEAREQRESAIEALDADTTKMNATFNGWLNSGKINEGQREQLGRLWELNYHNTEGEALGRELTFASNSIGEAYEGLVEQNLQSIQDNGGGMVIDQMNSAAESGDWSNVLSGTALWDSRNFYSEKGGADRKAMLEMYESMEPDVNAMGSLIDSYRENGEKIPQALLDAYDQAIEVGAASGSQNAAWQHYANSLMESGNDELIDAITNENNPMYETLRSEMAPELVKALDRAAYAAENATDSTDLSEFFNSILGLDGSGLEDTELDVGKVAELLEQFGYDMSEYLEKEGIELDGSGTEVKLKDFDPSKAAQYSGLSATGEAMELPGGKVALKYRVDEGQTLSGIAQEAGIALDELLAANPEITNPDVINIGQEIYIPADGVTVDASEVGDAVNDATQEAADSNETTQTTIDTTLTAGNTDDSGLKDEVQKDLDEMDPWETDGTANVTLEQTNNVDEIYNEVSDAAKNAFNSHISAAGTVDVVLKWNIINPTASISTTVNGGTATAVISSAVPYKPHAEGGIFDTPHYGVFAEAGPEAFIPLDGSDHAKAIWQEAGEYLGMADGPAATALNRPSETAAGAGGVDRSSGREINININGNGKISLGGGLSKDDVIAVVMDQIKDAVMGLLQDEIQVEGDAAYEY